MWISGALDGFRIGMGLTLNVTASNNYYYTPFAITDFFYRI
ncbi:hypothetical protein XBFM1_320049 [Xenorhabdus bovienii str. feltiae Moldova]|uniref:Uncharacterized protein n=1 Tax=Xenorhabdus bovienii str. feltiae Moldova TaxID=1398200 RepID=A0A077NYR6_XENBV|nr:hypothetical protein XBFM1_320049 [Xenorhabdus bovienii str. feltiae Moldova]